MISKLRLLVRIAIPVILLAIILWWFSPIDAINTRRFVNAISSSSTVLVLHEGLPHHTFESNALEHELQTKLSRQLHGYPFYQLHPILSDEDAKELTNIFSKSDTYRQYSGPKSLTSPQPKQISA